MFPEVLSLLPFRNPDAGLTCSALAIILFVAAHLIPWLLDPYGLRKNGIRGPILAQLSNFWLAVVGAQRHKAEVIHGLHQAYGYFVRIAPNHVSIAHPDAARIVYGFGCGALKSDFYDSFVSIRTGVFNTRDRAEHARKRRIVAHIFSQQRVLEFEPYIALALQKLIRQWDALLSGDEKLEHVRTRANCDGRVWFDSMKWFNYLAFDIIGDLAFGEPFGMVEAAADRAPVALHNGNPSTLDLAKGTSSIVYLPAIKILNDRGEYAASMGYLPAWARPFAKHIPWYAKGNRALQSLSGVAIAAIDKRLSTPIDRSDLLTYLQRGKDAEGKAMGRSELIAETLTQLAAGSDTVSNSACAIAYWLCSCPEAQRKLQGELDHAIGDGDDIPTYEQLKRLPYLNAVIKEGLRIHTTSASGLPRVAPPGGLEVCGIFIPEGCILSVPQYTIHRNTDVWGEDADAFRPERWFEQDPERIQQVFYPFSLGPRGCVGKNLALVELLLILGTIFHRYDVVLQDAGRPMETREGFSRKPVTCFVGIKRRHS